MTAVSFATERLILVGAVSELDGTESEIGGCHRGSKDVLPERSCVSCATIGGRSWDAWRLLLDQTKVRLRSWGLVLSEILEL